MGADMLRQLSGPTLVEKIRHDIPAGGFTWEVDVFSGVNAGLVLAEIELPAADTPVTLPDWLGREVTQDPRFTNHALSVHPFTRWGVKYQDLL